jgi:hypothetical protein
MKARYYETDDETEHEVQADDQIPTWLKWTIYLTFAVFLLLVLL